MKIILFISIAISFIVHIYVYLQATVENKPFKKQKIRSKPSPPFVVAMICANKVDEYRSSLESLLKVRGIDNYEIIISQSGNNQQVRDVTDSFGLNTITHVDDFDIDKKLAVHFQWTFNTIFEMRPGIKGIVVVEDDLLFSPDFLEYFELTIPVLENDPTVIAISAWNDNGLKHITEDLHELRRTSFFPGLGWYLDKHIWKTLLNPDWRPHAWDWHVRDVASKRDMEIIFPEVSRDYHAAKHGTYMNSGLFLKYFKNVNYNTDESFRWSPSDVDPIKTSKAYEKHIMTLIGDDNVKKVWNTETTSRFDKIMSARYKVWHEGRRGEWKGVKIIRDKGIYTLLIDSTKYPHYRRPIVTL